MSNKDDGKTYSALKALLEGRKLNRKDFGNASLHSWISTIRNRWFIPVESVYTHDSTCDYFMLGEEISRFKNPEQRIQQRQEMKEQVFRRRQQHYLKRVKQITSYGATHDTITCKDKLAPLEAGTPGITGVTSHD